jgi:hypothetical protein
VDPLRTGVDADVNADDGAPGDSSAEAPADGQPAMDGAA